MMGMTRSHRLTAIVLFVGLVTLYPSRGSGASGELSEPARWLQGYLRIASDTPEGEARAAAYLADILHREGVATQLLVSPEGRTSLYARLEADGGAPESAAGEAGALVLTHHTDVVPAGNDWTRQPYGGEIKNGRLYGRGALDIKSLGIAQLAAFVELARSDAPLVRDVIYLAVADEEKGGLQGTGWTLERHGDLFDDVAAVLGEGGANRTVNGRALWAGIEIAQKRPLWMKATTRGRPGHGSSFNPGSAGHRLISALDRILDRPAEFKVTEPARIYLGALAPLHNEVYREIFSNLDEHVPPEGPGERWIPGLSNLFLDTVQVTVLRAGEKINVIPGEATAEIDVRLLPETDGDAFFHHLQEVAGPGVKLEVLLTAPPAPHSPIDHAIYRAMAGVFEETAPAVPAFIPGFTDSRFFRERGVPAYGVSPFFLEPQDFIGIHGPDESIPLDELDRGVERMRRIVEACAVRGAGETG